MPAQVSQGLLMSELGSEFIKAHEVAKNVVATPGGELPSGVRGVAQLKGCEIRKIAEGKQNAGKLMFFAYGICVSPETHDGIKCVGKRTMITEPIYNTPTRVRKTIKDHIDEVYKHLKLLGLPVQALKPDQIEAAMKQLLNPKQPVFFEFRTWQPPKQTEGQYAGKDSQMMHFWDGKTDWKPKTATIVVQSSVPETPPDVPEPMPEYSANGSNHPQSEPIPTTQPSTSSSGSVPPAVTTATGSSDDFDDAGDLASLVKRATDQDLVAVQRLTEMALAKGMSQGDIDSATSWDVVGDFIRNGGDSTSPDEGKTLEIEVGGNYLFKPFDPIKKAKAEKPVTVRVENINEKDGKLYVDLKNMANVKIWYKNIDADELEPLL